MLKVNLNKTQKTELSQFLKDEVESCLSDRIDLTAKWAKWERQYEGKPDEEKKTFPWDGCCNIVVPVTGSIIDALLARVMDMWKVSPFFTAASLNPEIDQFTQPIGELLEWANRHELKLFQTMIPTILSTLKFGNGFGKMVWVSANKWTAQPGAEYRHVPINDMLFPPGTLDIHTAKWCGDRVRYTYSDLRKLERQGLISGITKLKDIEPEFETADDLTNEQENLTLISGRPGEFFTVYDLQVLWDVNNDGIDEDIHVVCLYPDFRLLTVWMNEYGHRPYRHFKMFPRENGIYAMGLCEYLSDLQDEMTTTHRQRVDNATLANTRFFKAKSGAIGVKPGMKIWPGRVLVMDDPQTDLISEQMGEVYQSSVQNEMILMSMIEKRAGLSDVAMGKAPRRETATTTLALIQEGNKRLDFLITYIKAELAELGMDYIELHRQFAPSDKVMRIMGEDGQKANVILNLPDVSMRGRLLLDVTAGSDVTSKEVQRQQLVQLFSLFKEFYMGMFELAGMVGNPQVPPLVSGFALKVINSATLFMEQIADDFDVKNAKELIPVLNDVILEMKGVGQMNQQMGGMMNGNGTDGGGASLPTMQPGMAGVESGMAGPTPGNGNAGMGFGFMGGVS